MHYYNKKYPYLNYGYIDTDGIYTMFSIPPEILMCEYIKTFKEKPKTFFDCGAATGFIVFLAQKLGMDAQGIDIKKYPRQSDELEELFTNGKIQIKSILDCEPIKSDIVFCNGTFTYFTEKELSQVLNKFNKSKMIFAVHNTTEDTIAALANGNKLTSCNKTRLIKSQNWWTDTFKKNGFNTKYIDYIRCFCITPTHE